MGTQLEYNGGGYKTSISADLKLSFKFRRAVSLEATTAGLDVYLPDARTSGTGYKMIKIVNHGTNSFDIVDFDGGAVATCNANDVFVFASFDDTTAAGDWSYGEWVLGSAAAPAATVFPYTLGGLESDMQSHAWKYDFTADTWSQSAGTTVSLETFNRLAGARIQGNGYIGNASLDHQEFNPDTWTKKTDHTYARDEAQAHEKNTTDDQAYYFGSSVSGNSTRNEYYDLSGDNFTSATAMSQAKWKGGAARSGTKIFVFDGTSSHLSVHFANTVNLEYNVSGDSWSTKTANSVGRIKLSYSVDTSDNPYLYNGQNKNTGGGIIFYDDVESYSVSGDSWTTKTDYAGGAASQGCATHIEANGRNYIVAGSSNNHYHHVTLTDSYSAKANHGSGVAREASSLAVTA